MADSPRRRTVWKRFSLVLASVVFGAPFSLGTVLLPTVGGPALAQPGCYSVSYGSTMIFTCPLVDQCDVTPLRLTCSSAGRFIQYCLTNPGVPPCAAYARSTSGRGGGAGQNSGTSQSNAPTPGVINKDVKVVKDCAVATTPEDGPPHLLSRAMGSLTVRYGDATVVIHQRSGTALVTGALGKTERHPVTGRLTITIDQRRVASRAEDEDKGYWRVFAETLLHEYQHAWDFHSCACNNPHERLGMTWDDYEEDVEQGALDGAKRLAACLPD